MRGNLVRLVEMVIILEHWQRFVNSRLRMVRGAANLPAYPTTKPGYGKG